MIYIKNYTHEDIDYIIDNYTNMTVNELSEKLNKKPGSIYNVIRKLGLKKQQHSKWTTADIAYLKEHYIDQTSEEIAKYLGKTINAVNAKRDEYGLIRHRKWTNDELDYLKTHYSETPYVDIASALNRTNSAIIAKCFELGLYKETPWTDDEFLFLKDNYSKMSRKEIAEVLNRTVDAVGLKATRNGLKSSPYYCDYHFFDNIDTEEKAYWLGFLTADGWAYSNQKTNSGIVGIELQYGDINHLRKFNKSINGNYSITDRWRKCSLSDKDKKNHFCGLRIFSKIMCEDLLMFGFNSDKSYNIEFPKLPKYLIRHYIRGYFDGDGSFCLSNKSFHVGFVTASKEFADGIVSYLNSIGIDIKNYQIVNEFNTTIYRPDMSSLQGKIQLLDYMYKDCSIYLDRKYKKYLKAKQKYDSQNGLAAQKCADKSKNAEEIGNAGMPTRVEG